MDSVVKRSIAENDLTKAVQDLETLWSSKLYVQVVIYRKYYFETPSTAKNSEFIMLDGSADMQIIDKKMFDSFADPLPQTNRNYIVDSILNLYSNVDEKRVTRELPLLFVTNILCTNSQKEELRTYIGKIKEANTDIQLFDSLDTTSITILTCTDNYKQMTEKLYVLACEFPGCICNTHVGCYRKHKSQWSEGNLIFNLSVAQKNPKSLTEKFETKFTENINKKYIQTGNNDRSYIVSKANSSVILEMIEWLNTNDVSYEFTPQLHVIKPETGGRKYVGLERSKQLQMIAEDLEKFKKECISNKETAIKETTLDIVLRELLNRILDVFERMKDMPDITPLADMLAYSLKGFVKTFPIANEDYRHEAFHSVSDYLSELLRILESTAFRLSFHSQTPGNTELFRAVSARLIHLYYILADSLSFKLRTDDNKCEVNGLDKTPDGSKLEDLYYYLLAPDAYPAVHIKMLFPSVRPPNERLLVVGFPQLLLFHPRILLPSLVHEIAHYAGNYPRQRYERMIFFVNATNFFLAEALCVAQIDPNRTDGEKEHDIEKFNKCYAAIDEIVCEFLNELPKSKSYYIYEAKDIFSEIIKEVTKGYNLELIARAMLDDNATLTSILEEKIVLAIAALRNVMLNAPFFMNQLADICSEVYADLVSIVTLGLSEEDYIHCLYFNGAKDNPNAVLMYTRLQIVLEICGFSIPSSNCEIGGEHTPAPCAIVSNQYTKWLHENNNQKLASHIIGFAVDYFKVVYARLNEQKEKEYFICFSKLYASLRK